MAGKVERASPGKPKGGASSVGRISSKEEEYKTMQGEKGKGISDATVSSMVEQLGAGDKGVVKLAEAMETSNTLQQKALDRANQDSELKKGRELLAEHESENFLSDKRVAKLKANILQLKCSLAGVANSDSDSD